MSSMIPRPKPKSIKQKYEKPKISKAIKVDITSIDPLGQGVSPVNDKPCFISKTLPDETCEINIIKQRKGVQFAQLINVIDASPKRQASECEHYDHCSGCHFLHTSYQEELAFKKDALHHYFHSLEKNTSLKNHTKAINNILLTPSQKRFNYRNRIQLHYDTQSIGLINGLNDEIIEIPNCQLMDKQLKPALASVYDISVFPKIPIEKDYKNKEKKNVKGHCEIYLKDNEVVINWNKQYSQGGFTQVNAYINDQLIKRLVERFKNKNIASILDLFSGKGNLSTPIQTLQKDQAITRHMIDAFPSKDKDFECIDLYDNDALKNYMRRNKTNHYELMIVDPPRKGFPNINDWVYKYKPKKLVYVSCYPATLARDLKTLKGKFNIDHIEIFDMFPGTYHFETFVEISFKQYQKSKR